jgi:hypothetical protein
MALRDAFARFAVKAFDAKTAKKLTTTTKFPGYLTISPPGGKIL